MAESRRYDVPADALFRIAHSALAAMRPEQVEVDAPHLRADAVFRVFFFLDDVAVAVHPDGAGAVLHVRSRSRVGQWDAWVNRRRVNAFLRRVDHTSPLPRR